MAATTYDDNPGARDPWTSALWADPATVAGYATETLTTPPPVVPSLPPEPPRRSPWQRPLVALGIFLLAVLVGIGAANLIPRSDGTMAAAAPKASAPAAPALPSPSATDPNATDPNATDPNGTDPNATAPGARPGTSQGAGATTTLSAAAAAVAPSIVDIATTVGYDGAQAAGTGEILTTDGVILTNHHVISGATAISVTVTATGKTYQADVVGYDTSHDIGVLKMRDASGLTVTPIGDSSTVRVGDAVVGLGNAGGVGGQPIEAAGKVTGLDRSITAMNAENGTSEDLHGLIETDADIEPGDSGGSLISADGKVIGIITAGSVSSGQRSTTTDGFAIPINQAMSIAQDIRDGRASATVHIGASAFLGVKAASSSSTARNGVVISGVVPGSAAQKAGLAAGATVTAIDGVTVTSPNALRSALAPHHPGDSISLSWTDSQGAGHTSTVTLGTGPVG